MDYLPLFLDIRNQQCLVVGGGEVALRKVRLLYSAGAVVRVVSPLIHKDIETLLANADHQLYARTYQPEDMDDVKLVIAATSDGELNLKVSQHARQKNLFVNVVDDGQVGNAIMPSIVDRSPVITAFSTGGKAPVMARHMRQTLEGILPANYGNLAEMAGRFRHRVISEVKDINRRRQFWEDALQSIASEKALRGDLEGAERLLEQLLYDMSDEMVGEVYLIGAGPGDPELLTFKALRLMQQADVVLYDNLVSKEIVDLCRRDADLIYVGKRCSNHTFTQEEINSMMVDFAKVGKRVARLKGGDPFIFGRGGEELETLAEANIPFQIVPGITAASGCASYAGIPLTHRDYAQSAQFITGHCKFDADEIDWDKMKDPRQTLVFYMGINNLDKICNMLIKFGTEPERPVAIVYKGTTAYQRVFTGTVDTIADIAKEHKVKPPSLIIIGNVVKLKDKLEWFNPVSDSALHEPCHC
ncbi:siroheme synthase CysG [Endozoicomonas sp. 4G]|uniref:siroheme synthase CysG n=1 Tax=Endozoicomonas sp. 4G TaxID=2872754 RepID=UPI0020790A73|nr:siroheme synthase CysG [Endozoicomonas sp. 4G]